MSEFNESQKPRRRMHDGTNLWLPIVVHGSYATVGITMIDLDRYPALRQALA